MTETTPTSQTVDPAAPPPTDPPPQDPNQTQDPPRTEGDTKPPADPGKETAPTLLTADALKPPEGGELHPELTTKFLDILNNGEMSPADRANALLGLQSEAMKAASEESSALWQKTQEDWQKETREDPDIGGEKLEENLADIRKLMDQFGSKELEDLMDFTGVGNNVHHLKFLHKIAKAFTEGGPHLGGPADERRDAASILYPSMGS